MENKCPSGLHAATRIPVLVVYIYINIYIMISTIDLVTVSIYKRPAAESA